MTKKLPKHGQGPTITQFSQIVDLEEEESKYLCWTLTKFWEFLGHVDLFWDFDCPSKEERKLKWRSWDLSPLWAPFWVFWNM